MAIEKNITMKQFNGTDYDTLYPETIASQIPDVYSKTEVLALIDDKVRIQTGSYAGTGTYGESNKNSLTFSFPPKYVQIYLYLEYARNCYGVFYYSPQIMYSCSTITNGLMSPVNLHVSVNGNTISWYSDNYQDQLNNSSGTYYYVAIG